MTTLHMSRTRGGHASLEGSVRRASESRRRRLGVAHTETTGEQRRQTHRPQDRPGHQRGILRTSVVGDIRSDARWGKVRWGACECDCLRWDVRYMARDADAKRCGKDRRASYQAGIPGNTQPQLQPSSTVPSAISPRHLNVPSAMDSVYSELPHCIPHLLTQAWSSNGILDGDPPIFWHGNDMQLGNVRTKPPDSQLKIHLHP